MCRSRALLAATLVAAAATAEPAGARERAVPAPVAAIKTLYGKVHAALRAKTLKRHRLQLSATLPAVGAQTNDYLLHTRGGAKGATLARVVLTHNIAASAESYEELVFDQRGRLAFYHRRLDQTYTPSACGMTTIENIEEQRLYFAGSHLVRAITDRRPKRRDALDSVKAACAAALRYRRLRDKRFSKVVRAIARRVRERARAYAAAGRALAANKARRAKRLLRSVDLVTRSR